MANHKKDYNSILRSKREEEKQRSYLKRNVKITIEEGKGKWRKGKKGESWKRREGTSPACARRECSSWWNVQMYYWVLHHECSETWRKGED